ncbi:hypothetical protein OG458_42195 (plasmid) [Streptomyces sp. NBC_01281]|uniref:DUF6884 domain-containing protein n=1 Tax=Streptomyces sp. NBC_01281 TaxID=2903811 RepID=UPI002E10550B|nr:DUF6884 domain-containing protein [Streptomyces sp. NBC_01281]WSK66568.1 hypothetical protein OG458_42195 [Streptomyces sp. NBC_01281]
MNNAPARPRVIIVSCGGTKSAAEQPIPAGERYTGSYHRALRRAANALTQAGPLTRTYILSALHGLLALHDPITPYDLRMGDAGSVTSEQLHQQAADRGILDADVTVLGPRAYVALSRTVWPQLTDPLAGARGIGHQLARLATIYNNARRQPARPMPRPAFSSSSSFRDEMECRAIARLEVKALRDVQHRSRYAIPSQLTVHSSTQAQGNLTFPGDASKSSARALATCQFAGRYRVEARMQPSCTRKVDVHGAPRDVARFLSALPRILEKTEARASEAARLYGRWEHHSNARPHLVGLTGQQRRARARDFRAEAFNVVVGVLLDRPECVPEARSGLPPWSQVYPLTAGIAHYYWLDLSDLADADETARILAHADRSGLADPVQAECANRRHGVEGLST